MHWPEFLQHVDNSLKHIDTSKPFIIVGDSNIDVQDKNNTVTKYMETTFHCKRILSKPTTSYGTTINLCFTNCEVYHHDLLSCAWSDHKTFQIVTELSNRV